MSRKPHIVIFVPDSYRGDVIGHLGNPGAVTPNLDAIVAQGGAVSYANAFTQNPVCTPSRCSFMTGWYPHTHGHRSMRNMLKEHEPNLLKVLRREGWHTWWGGKNDLVAVTSKDEYGKYCDQKHAAVKHDTGHRLPPLPDDHPLHGLFYRGVARRGAEGAPFCPNDDSHVRGAVELIRNPPADKPLCIYLPLSFPHPAYAVEEEFYNLIDPDRLPPRIPVPEGKDRQPPLLEALRHQYDAHLADEAGWREIKRIYYGMCAKVDHLFGQVVDALREQSMYDDTLILFFSDHGDFAGDYSLPEKTHATLQDALVRTPLIIKPPKGVDARPGVRRHLAELVDISATIYDLFGIQPGYDHQGRSLRASLAGAEDELHDAVFAEVGSRRTDTSFKNLDVLNMPPRSFYWRQSQAALACHGGGSYAVMCRTLKHKYIRRGYMTCHELYDLERDPDETDNLSGNPAYADIERRLETRLLDFFMTTGDVLPHEQDSRGV